MSPEPLSLLKQASIVIDPDKYVVLRLPPTAIMLAAGVVAEVAEPFCALLVDAYEVTLIAPAAVLEDFASRLRGHQALQETYRLLTFDIELDANVVGFMALVSRAMADVGVSILPLAAYSRDHILIQDSQVETALQALRRLQSST